MNDQVLMENYLLILKSSVEVYVHGTLESSNKDIRELLKLGLDETMMHQANCYNEMTKYGWYTVNNVNASAINKIVTKINSSK